MYDVAIVGSGPAAVSAAINLQIHNKDIIMFGQNELSNKVEISEKIINYPGFLSVSGSELNNKLKEHISSMNIQVTERMVTTISKLPDSFMILADNEVYEAKTILLCVGATSAKGFPGEDELLGKGVSYCATCDGFLYKDKKIAVFISDKKYEHEVKYLSELAKEVYLFSTFTTDDIGLGNVVISDKPMKMINGVQRVEGITLTDGTLLEVEGVFILRNAVAPAKLISGLSMDGSHIMVGRNMETNIEGCFAAGDCTGRPYQIAKAIGEGNVAAHSIIEYLA